MRAAGLTRANGLGQVISSGAAGGAGASGGTLKLFINAGEASMGPPIGPALGQRGIKAIDFCKQFNEQSLAIFRKGTPLRCIVSTTPDRKFSFRAKTPTTTHLLKSTLGIPKLSTRYHVATTTPPVLLEIARVKCYDVINPAAAPAEEVEARLRAIYRMILATARANGIRIQK